MLWFHRVCAVMALLPSLVLHAAETSNELVSALPDEYETVGGHALGLGNAGMAAASGVSSVRLNPAMIAMEPNYSVSAGYHWPRSGRDFFNAGVIDSKTSPVAAAFSYTGFTAEYGADSAGVTVVGDSPVLKRAGVGLAQAFNRQLLLGIAGHFVEGAPFDDPEGPLVKGWSVGIGAAVLVTPTLRAGLSAENLANAKVADYAPRTLRAGVAWTLSDAITAHLDFRQRDRVDVFEAPLTDISFSVRDDEATADAPELKAEQMLIGSFSARVYDVIRFLGAYGQSVNDGRRLLAGGIAVVNDQMSLSYGASREDMRDQTAHQAINLNLSVAL